MNLDVTPFESDLVNIALQATAGSMTQLVQKIAQQRQQQAAQAGQQAAEQEQKAEAAARAAVEKASARRSKRKANGAPHANGAEQPPAAPQ